MQLGRDGAGALRDEPSPAERAQEAFGHLRARGIVTAEEYDAGHSLYRPIMRSGPLRHRWFALFTATVTSGSIGDEIMRLALPLLVLDVTHDIGAAATLRVIETIPYVLFGAFAGALIDPTQKRRLLAIPTILSILFTVFIPLSIVFGFFSIGLLYVMAFVLGAVEVVWGITSDFSVVPALVQPDELPDANATYLTADRVARIVGPPLGGLAVCPCPP